MSNERQISEQTPAANFISTDWIALDDADGFTYKASGAQLLSFVQVSTSFSGLNNTPALTTDYALFSVNSDHTALIESGILTNADNDLNIPAGSEFQIDGVSINQFLQLTDTPSAYAAANTLYKTNATTNGLIATSTIFNESVSNELALTIGTTAFKIVAGSLSLSGLTNDRVMVSSAGNITESSSITTAELGLLDGMVGFAIGSADNDRFATKGYVDEHSATGYWEMDGTILRVKDSASASSLDLTYGTIPISCSGLTSYGHIATVGGSLNLAVNQSITIGSKTLSCDAAITHKIVGYSQFVDYQTIGVAMSNISDSAETKRYLLTMAPVDLGSYEYQAGNVSMTGDPYVNVSMLSGRLNGYLRVGDNNAVYIDEIYSTGDGNSGLVKASGSGHSYAFVNKIKAGNVNSRSCSFSNAGILDLYTNYLEVGYGTAIGGDPVSGESSSGDVNAFANYIKLTTLGDVINNAVVAKNGGKECTFINRVDCVGNLKRMYSVENADSGLYGFFNFSQAATYLLHQSNGYASILGGYADGGMYITGNQGTWATINRQGSGTNYISTLSAPVYLNILECNANIDVQAGSSVYLNTQNLSGNIDTNNGVGKLVCNIAEWSGTFVSSMVNVNGFIGKYADTKMYLYGYNLHLNPTKIANAHYRAGTRLIIEDEECHAQFIADDDGAAWGSYLMLSLAPSTGNNKHWLIHHSGTSQSDELKFEYGYSTSSSSFSLSEKMMLGIDGKLYLPGLGLSSGGKDLRYNTTTGEIFYVD